jgi:phage gp36-like protein
MPYASEQDLMIAAGSYERLVQLTDEDGDGLPDLDRIGAALDRGDAFVNRYLPPRYQIPLARPTPQVIQIAADEGVFFLVSSKGMATSEEIAQAALRRQDMQDMRDGKLWPSDPLPRPTSGLSSAYVENGRPISRQRMRGFI